MGWLSSLFESTLLLRDAAAASRPGPHSVGAEKSDGGQRGQGIACVAEQVTCVHGFTSWKSAAGWLSSRFGSILLLRDAAAASRPSPNSVGVEEADGGQCGQGIACVAEQVTSVHGFTSWKSAVGWLSNLPVRIDSVTSVMQRPRSRPDPHSVAAEKADGGQRGQCIACVAEQVTSVHGFTSWKRSAVYLMLLSAVYHRRVPKGLPRALRNALRKRSLRPKWRKYYKGMPLNPPSR